MTTYAENIAARVASGELQIINEFKGEFRWLSNFYWHYSMNYTVEHEFQAAKAAGYDVALANKIIRADTPGKAKELGRKVDLPADWNTKRETVMYNAVMSKFNRPGMKDWLIATGKIPLVEGNYWHDNYWGDCFCSRCSDEVGLNKLGLILMRVRSKLEYQELSYSYGSDVFVDPETEA